MYFQPVHRRVLATIVVMLMGAFWCGVAAAASHAGQIMFTFGNVTITGADGAVRAATRGEQIFSGETVTTAAGRVQIRFTDSSLVSLIPNTAYKIDEYQYSGQVDGSERGFFRLVKGGLRTVTGAIGRGDKANYRLTTQVATIGIRGTWFRAQLDEFGRLLVSVGFDPDDPSGLVVANAVGQIELDRGENAVVESADTPPVRTEQQVVIEPPPPPSEPLFVAGDDRNETGTQAILVPGVTSTVLTGFGLLGVAPDAGALDNVDVFSFDFDSALFLRDSDNNGIAVLGIEDEDNDAEFGLATIDIAAVRGGDNATEVSRAVTLLDQADPALVSFFEASPASVAEFFFNGEVGFGRWTNGRVLIVFEDSQQAGNIITEVDELSGFQSVHFLFGTQPPLLPTSGMAFYEFIGGTQSTTVSGATIGQGVLAGGFIDVNFGLSSASLNMDVQHNGVGLMVSGSLSIDPGDASLSDIVSGVPSVSATGGPCVPSCPTFIDAGFAGPAAGPFPKHIGLEYDIQAADVIMGVAAFGLQP